MIRRLSIAAILLTFSSSALATDQLLSFVTCPIARDMGPDGELCFFVEHNGQAIAVQSQGYGSPQLMHRLLVEGRIVDGDPMCGGLRMQGRISVLPELDGNCNTIIPHDGVSKGRISGVFFTGGPEQRALAEDLTRRAELDHRVTAEPAVYVAPPPPPPAPPFKAQKFTTHYAFGLDRSPGDEVGKLIRLAEYAQVSRAKSITIVGQAASTLLEDGERLNEDVSLARTRAEKAADVLIGLGVPKDMIKVSWKDSLFQGTGEDDWMNRRIDVELQL